MIILDLMQVGKKSKYYQMKTVKGIKKTLLCNAGGWLVVSNQWENNREIFDKIHS
jgi:hypothetical protein